jgi:hypothetical protein
VNDLNLMTDSDYQRVALAQKRGRTITVLREYKDFRLQVTTTPVEPPKMTVALPSRRQSKYVHITCIFQEAS